MLAQEDAQSRDVDASAQFQRISASSDVENRQLGISQFAPQYMRNQPRDIIDVNKLKLVLQVIAARRQP